MVPCCWYPTEWPGPWELLPAEPGVGLTDSGPQAAVGAWGHSSVMLTSV